MTFRPQVAYTSLSDQSFIDWLRRKFGMGVDCLLSVEMVMADGRVLIAGETENADLFWAIRGGGGNFGIVTAFEFRLYPVGPEVYFAGVLYPYTQVREILPAWREFTTTAPREVSTDAFIWSIAPAPVFPEAIHNEPIIGLAGIYAGPVEEGATAFQPLGDLGQPLVDMSGTMPYLAVQSAFDPLFPPYLFHHYWKALYLDNLDDEVVETILTWAGKRPSPMTSIPMRLLGGVIAQVGEERTALGHRQASFLVSIDATGADPANTAQNLAWTRDFWPVEPEY